VKVREPHPGIDKIRLTLVRTLDDVLDMMTWLGERRDWLAVDVETEGLNVGCDRIRLIQFGDHVQGFALDYKDWRGVAREVIHGYDRPMVAHNLLFDSKMLRADGITIPQHLAHDTMIMCHLKNAAGKLDLKGAATVYVDKRARVGQGLLKAAMAQQRWHWRDVPVELPSYWQYGVLDTCLTALLAETLWPDTGGGPYRDAYELELAVIHCLREAEIMGLQVDEEYRLAAEAQLRSELDVLAPQMPINPNSDDQVRKYLQSLGAQLFVLTDAGKLSVDKTVLEWLAPAFPIAKTISTYRQKSKLLDSYITKFGEIGTTRNGLAVGGVLRPSTKPVGAKTGRQSVTDPPLQTLPRGRVVRDAVIPRPGHVFVMADFAGMEMRALASDARETTMLTIFNDGKDVHNETARALYGDGFSKPQRTVCKNAGFAKIYGAGVEKFAVTAKIDVGAAREFLTAYDALYTGVADYMGKVTQRIYERAGGREGVGYVTLIDGRRLPVPGDEAYKGVNYRIQGSCAIVMKRKIEELDRAGLGPYFRLAVHDELIYEVPLDLALDARRVIEAVMPDRRSFPGVTLEIDSDMAHRWGYHYRDDFPKYVETPEPEWLRELEGAWAS
jgi:DNA polymerase-1